MQPLHSFFCLVAYLSPWDVYMAVYTYLATLLVEMYKIYFDPFVPTDTYPLRYAGPNHAMFEAMLSRLG